MSEEVNNTGAAEEVAPEATEVEPEEAVEAEAVEAEAPEEADDLTAAKLEALEMRDRYLRLQAEWDNFRKRTATEREAEKARAAEKLVVDLLPVLDDLERAIAHAKQTGEGGTLTDGVEAIQNKCLQILGKHQVAAIPAEGQAFDANLHQAVSMREDAEVYDETVLECFQKGYTMGGRVLRPAMVITSTGGPARPAEEE